jgi:hypothetical protein
LVAAPFSQVSLTMNNPAMHNPEMARIMNHVGASGVTRCISSAPEPSDASPANTRTCPTRAIVAGVTTDPSTKPT